MLKISAFLYVFPILMVICYTTLSNPLVKELITKLSGDYGNDVCAGLKLAILMIGLAFCIGGVCYCIYLDEQVSQGVRQLNLELNKLQHPH